MKIRRALSSTALIILMLISGLGASDALGASRRHQSHHYYRNSSGHMIHRPVHARRAPRGATAECYDGTYSFSAHHQGTCSHHGGVRAWLK